MPANTSANAMVCVTEWVCVACRETVPAHAAHDCQPVDLPLDAARAVLEGLVCECGHFESDHIGGEEQCDADDVGGCACPRFTAVRFTVERAR